MPVFRSSCTSQQVLVRLFLGYGPFLGCGLILGLAWSIGVTPAMAQIGPPVRLLPPSAQTPAAQTPAPQTPAPQQTLAPPTSSTPPAAQPAPTAPAGIAVDTLAAPDAAGAGALDAADRPFPTTLWQGTSAALVLALAPRIVPTPSATLDDMAYRLLASPATPPASEPGATATALPAAPSPIADAAALLAMRADRLLALGHPDAAGRVLDAVPRDQVTEAMAIARVQMALLANDASGACAITRDRGRPWQGVFWDQALVTCQVIQGEPEGASVSLGVLRERKGYKDDGFAALVDRVLSGVGKADTLPAPQVLSLSLIQAAKLALPKDLPPQTGAAVLRAIARASALPIEQRIVAAERAAVLGALSTGDLADLLARTPLTPDDEDNPIARADQLGGARGRALLYALARKTTIPAGRGALLAAILIKAPRLDAYPVMARLVAPLLVALPPSDALKPLAGEFARALYAAGQPVAALAWLNAADPAVAATVVPFARIAAPTTAPALGHGSLIDLYAGAGGKKDVVAARKATLAAGLMVALDDPPPDEATLSLLSDAAPPDGKPGDPKAAPGSVPATEPWLLLRAASAGHRVGATVLATLVALGGDGPAASPLLLERAIESLGRAGLVDEGRRLAVDAAIAGGL
ncbi:MAG TPA: hypothetical protein VNT30_22190 [Stellaceae bacterium]|nr:hypothetical protein [Stellaceae bacterium]